MVLILLAVAGALAGSYGLVLGALWLGQRRLIYLPDRVVPERARAGAEDMAEVRLATTDGLALLAWYRAPADETKPCLVYFHGNSGHLGMRASKARPYLDAGYGVLLPAWRGFSGNPGRPTEAGLYADGEAALAFLESHRIGATRRVLYGESLGTGVAVEMALRHDAKAVVLEAPFTSVPDVGRHRFPIFPVNAIVADRFDSMAKISTIGAPLLLLHGNADRVVPSRFGRRLFEAAVEPKRGHFIEGAAHNDLYDFGAAERVLAFLAELEERTCHARGAQITTRCP